MKSIIVILVVYLFTLSSSAKAQWVNISLDPDIKGEIQATNDPNIFYILQSNKIKKSTDAGNTWTTVLTLIQHFGPSYQFNFPTSEIGYVWNPYNDSTLIKTTDGGVTWTNNSGVGLAAYKIQFINAHTGFVCGWNSPNECIYKTTNGGINFNLIFTVDTGTIRSIDFLSENIGYAVVTKIAQNSQEIDHANLFKTYNGGDNWVNCSELPGFNAQYMDFVSNGIGIIVGYKIETPPALVVYVTTNDGGDWNIYKDTLGGWFGQSVILNNGFGYIPVSRNSLEGFSIKTTNFGISWSQEESLPVAPRYIIKSNNFLFLTSEAWSNYGGVYRKIIDEPLPVELAAFTSSVNANNITLNWVTSSETNNSEFHVERRNGSNWETVGYVEGNGTSTSPHPYQYNDRDIQAGSYSYRLKQIDYNGNFEYHNLSNEVVIGVPKRFNLKQNYPNPFNPTTRIEYTVPYDGIVTLIVYDINGREIRRVLDEQKSPGYYLVDINGSNLSSGIYYYRLTSDNYSETKKMMLVK